MKIWKLPRCIPFIHTMVKVFSKFILNTLKETSNYAGPQGFASKLKKWTKFQFARLFQFKSTNVTTLIKKTPCELVLWFSTFIWLNLYKTTTWKRLWFFPARGIFNEKEIWKTEYKPQGCLFFFSSPPTMLILKFSIFFVFFYFWLQKTNFLSSLKTKRIFRKYPKTYMDGSTFNIVFGLFRWHTATRWQHFAIFHKGNNTQHFQCQMILEEMPLRNGRRRSFFGSDKNIQIKLL